MNVYVFKTSLKKRDIKFIKSFFDSLLPNANWNVDFKDCDRILRVESKNDISDLVCEHISELGFFCVELEV
jgi:hypothetical protein